MHRIAAGALSFASGNRVTLNDNRWKRNQRNMFSLYKKNPWGVQVTTAVPYNHLC